MKHLAVELVEGSANGLGVLHFELIVEVPGLPL